jgi:TrmH family RNA methyltransferase
MKKISTMDTPSNVVALCKKIVNKNIGRKILLLDEVQDPGNLGTIIRSSVAFGVDTVVLSNNTVDLYNDKVLRSSEGMVFHIDIVKRDVYELVDLLHDKGYKVYGTKVDGGTDLKNVTVSDKCVIVMGNEGNGVTDKLLDKCDEYIYIPMSNECESLNVGVATSIILYELL